MSKQPRREEDPLDRFWNDLPRLIEQDDARAVRGLLSRGISVYYSEEDTPDGLLVRENPDGTRQLVRISFDGGDTVVRDL